MAGIAAARRSAGRYPPPPPEPPAFPPFPAVPHRAVFVDREKTCPTLLRVFPKIESHHTKEDFAVRGKVPKSEFHIYTWKDATLRELTHLVKEITPEARRKDAWLSFALVFPDRRGCFVIRRVGKTFSYGTRKVDDDKTLAELGFQAGDYIDVAVF